MVTSSVASRPMIQAGGIEPHRLLDDRLDVGQLGGIGRAGRPVAQHVVDLGVDPLGRLGMLAEQIPGVGDRQGGRLVAGHKVCAGCCNRWMATGVRRPSILGSKIQFEGRGLDGIRFADVVRVEISTVFGLRRPHDAVTTIFAGHMTP
jgi:hypothetical protein